MNIIFKPRQEWIIEEAVKNYKTQRKQVFQFVGRAGTGKSLIVGEIIRRLRIPPHRVAVMTYTGAAAIILRMRGVMNASTIHSWLYRPIDEPILDENNQIIKDTYFNIPQYTLSFEPKPLSEIDLIFIDEAGMVPYSMKKEIESRGIPIIACGDLNQLPPIEGKSAYLYDGDVLELTDLMRQDSDSAKVYIAERIINNQPIHQGFYGDVLVINDDELLDNMVLYSDVVLSYTNNTRDFVNNKVRDLLNHSKSQLPELGEKVICRKNNWDLSIDGINMANGLRGTVVNSPDMHGFNGKSYTIDFKPDMMNKAFLDLKCDYKYLIAPTKQKHILKNDRFSEGEKMEFGYSSTVHLSQGSQYNNVCYIEEYAGDIQSKLDYTAVTRAINNLIYVKHKRKYY